MQSTVVTGVGSVGKVKADLGEQDSTLLVVFISLVVFIFKISNLNEYS